MTPTPGTAVRLARLRHEISIDLEALESRSTELAGILAGHRENQPSRTTGIVAAVNIHAWYTALETAFERIARLLDESIPDGPAWHADLISQMAIEVPGLRPALVNENQRRDLEEIRKFRHFFRNAYVLEFDTSRIRELAELVTSIEPVVSASLRQLIEHISGVLDSLQHG